MLNAVAEACRELTSFSDFWLLAALGDWSFEEGARNSAFARYLYSWHEPDSPLPTDLLSDVRLGINGVLCRLVGQQAGVKWSNRNPSSGPDIVFCADDSSYAVEVKYIFDCAYTKQYENAIPADRHKHPEFQVVFFVSFPNYCYPAGRWYGGGSTHARQTNVIGVSSQYIKVSQCLGKTASWPNGSQPFCVDLPQGTATVTQERIQQRFARVFQPEQTWQFSTTKHLRGAQVGFAIWDWRTTASMQSPQPNHPQIDHKRALQAIDKFVMNAPWGELWNLLVHELIEPLGLTDTVGRNTPGFCNAAAANIRSQWPESWNNAGLWKARRGPWTTRDGEMKIIEIVRKTARDFAP